MKLKKLTHEIKKKMQKKWLFRGIIHLFNNLVRGKRGCVTPSKVLTEQQPVGPNETGVKNTLLRSKVVDMRVM